LIIAVTRDNRFYHREHEEHEEAFKEEPEDRRNKLNTNINKRHIQIFPEHKEQVRGGRIFNHETCNEF